MDIFPKVLLDFCTIVGGFSALVFIYEKIKKSSKRNIEIETIKNEIANKSKFDATEINKKRNKKIICFIIALLNGLFFGILVLILKWSPWLALILLLLVLLIIIGNSYIEKSKYKDYIEVVINVSLVSFFLISLFTSIYQIIGYSLNINIFIIINMLFSCYIGLTQI